MLAVAVDQVLVVLPGLLMRVVHLLAADGLARVPVFHDARS